MAIWEKDYLPRLFTFSGRIYEEVFKVGVPILVFLRPRDNLKYQQQKSRETQEQGNV